jgi:hypothetical protein
MKIILSRFMATLLHLLNDKHQLLECITKKLISRRLYQIMAATGFSIFLFVNKSLAQLNSFPYAFNFTTAQPSFVTITGSGIALNNTLTNCTSTITGGVTYSSTGKFWTFTATKCARVVYTVKEGSTARGVIVSNDKNSVTKTTKGANNGCITDTVDFNYDGSAGNITVKFAGGSGGSGEAVIAVNVYDAIVLPVTFISFKVAQQNNAVGINWSIASEVNINNYVVEKSTDANTFTEIGNINSTGSNSYSWLDEKSTNSDAYYRIKAVENSGLNLYSNVLKINTYSTITDVAIAPNPITNSRFALQLKSIAKDNYSVIIYNSIGQIVYRTAVNHAGGTATESIQLPSSIKKGIYTLSLSSSGLKINKTLFINQ